MLYTDLCYEDDDLDDKFDKLKDKVDDADEFSYAFWMFLDAIIPQVKDYLI